MNDELVTIASFAIDYEAQLARGYLQSNGIDVFLADEATSRIANHLGPIIGGFKLQVRGRDVDLARELLAEAQSPPPDGSPTNSR